MGIENNPLKRGAFLKRTLTSGISATLGSGLRALRVIVGGSDAASDEGEWKPTTCQGCTSWCSVLALVRDGRVIKVRGNPRSMVNDGNCCSKCHLAIQQVYDPDRIKVPMRRTNPRKGRCENPGFVPITWDEALGELADKIMELRRNNETHKYMLLRGRYTYMRDVVYDRMTKIIGSPNNISHSGICAEAEKFGSYFTEGVWDYRQYDVTNTRYMLLWGADPLSSNRQVSYYTSRWGDVLQNATTVVIDPRLSATASKADIWMPIVPGQDGALAVALAHVILSEGLWHREFVGDFRDGVNRFRPGALVAEDDFEEKHTHGAVKWWNLELNDKTPEWAAGLTGLSAGLIRRVAVDFARAAPRALCWVGGGPVMQVRGSYAGMAAHALNGLVGAVDNVGGTLAANPVHTIDFPVPDEFMDDIARTGVAQKKIDRRGTKAFPAVKEGKPGSAVVTNHAADGILEDDPYGIKVAVGYFNNFAFSCPQAERWERALSKIPFVVHVTTHASEFTHFSDIVLPAAHHMFEKWGYVKSHANGRRHVSLAQPVIEPVWDVKIDETEFPWALAEKLAERGFDNLLRHFATYEDPETGRAPSNEKEFALYALKYATQKLWDPAQYVSGDRFDGWADFLKAGVSNSDPYPYRARWGRMKTKTGKFEFYSETLKAALSAHAEKFASPVDEILHIANYQARGERAFVPHYEEPLQWGDPREFPFVHIDYKSRINREGRSANCPWYQEFKDLDPGDEAWDDVAKLNPADAAQLGIRDGDKIRLASVTGEIECTAKLWEGVRPGTVAKCYGQGHWAYGKVAARRFGKEPLGGNNNTIIPADYDRLSGSSAYYGITRVKVTKI